MPRRARCAESSELLAELAIGIADGRDRSRVLEHVAECSDCQYELERQAAVADGLLALAADEEPPPGFESRVLDSIFPAPARERTGRRFALRWLVPAVAVLASVVITAGAMWAGYRDDRQLADHYRSALAEAHGEYFGAVRLEDAAGRQGGVVFRYRGSPSWVVITVTPSHRRAVARAELVETTGRRIAIPAFRLVDGIWGGSVPVELGDVAAVELLRRDGRTELSAQLRNPSGVVPG
jgi:hypothetical protein